MVVEKGLPGTLLGFGDYARWEQSLSPREEFSPPQTCWAEGVGGEQVGL